MKEATIKRLKEEQAAWDDKYFIFKRNGVSNNGISQEKWDMFFPPKKKESSK